MNDALIGTEQLNRFWKPEWPTVHFVKQLPIQDYLTPGTNHFFFSAPRFSRKQWDEKVSQWEGGKYCVETAVAQSAETEDSRTPNLH